MVCHTQSTDAITSRPRSLKGKGDHSLAIKQGSLTRGFKLKQQYQRQTTSKQNKTKRSQVFVGMNKGSGNDTHSWASKHTTQPSQSAGPPLSLSVGRPSRASLWLTRPAKDFKAVTGTLLALRRRMQPAEQQSRPTLQLMQLTKVNIM